jgi:CspA family cold shock protein
VLLTSPASETDAFGLLSLLSSFTGPAAPIARGLSHIPRNKIMPTGTVKFFNTDRGYGFITNEAGGPDAFVHITAVERAGLGTIREGQKLSYELETGNNGKTSAVNLTDAS